MTHPILNRVPTVVFKGDNDNGRLPSAPSPLGKARAAISVASRPFGRVSTIAEWLVCFAVCVFIGLLLATGGAL